MMWDSTTPLRSPPVPQLLTSYGKKNAVSKDWTLSRLRQAHPLGPLKASRLPKVHRIACASGMDAETKVQGLSSALLSGQPYKPLGVPAFTVRGNDSSVNGDRNTSQVRSFDLLYFFDTSVKQAPESKRPLSY